MVLASQPIPADGDVVQVQRKASRVHSKSRLQLAFMPATSEVAAAAREAVAEAKAAAGTQSGALAGLQG